MSVLFMTLMQIAAQSPATEATPIGQFLRAADQNDFASMQSTMAPNFFMGPRATPSAEFIKKIGNCYLRRVYNNAESHELIAAWMCSDGANDSRVVLGMLTTTTKNQVMVMVVREDRNKRPAPARAGSAFADEEN